MTVLMTPGPPQHKTTTGDSHGKVLIIDDYEATRDTFVRLLELEGFQAEAVDCGLKGIQRASATNFDAILCDLRLPDISGLDVLRQLKTRGVTAPVAIMTRFPELDSSFEAGARGAAGFIAGMLIGDELVSVVNQAIRGPRPVHLPPVAADLNSPRLDDVGRTPQSDPELHRVLELFEKDPSLPAKTLASILEVAESTLRTRFRSCMHVPLGKFLAERRLDLAARRLLSSDDRVRDIAAYVGISDTRYFRKVFRKRFGVSPRAYRRRFSK